MGRELDAQVAEKVMGWKRVTLPGYESNPDQLLFVNLPFYSTSIEAAWPIIKVFRDLYPSDKNTRFFEALDVDELLLRDEAGAAEYICLSALRSVGEGGGP